MYALDPNFDSTLGTITASGGGTVVKASQIGVVGGYNANTGAVITPNPRTGIVPSDDPQSYVPAPPSGNCVKQGNYHVTGGWLDPGTYCGGMTMNAGGVITMHPGVDYIDGGGVTINGGANVQGSGIIVYNSFDNKHNYAGISIAGSASVTLSAPTSGPLEGILFFQDRSVPAGGPGSSIGGGAAQTYEGTLYFPTTSLTYTGGCSTSAKYTIIVTDTLTVSGNITLNDHYSALADGSPIKGAVLAQ